MVNFGKFDWIIGLVDTKDILQDMKVSHENTSNLLDITRTLSSFSGMKDWWYL